MLEYIETTPRKVQPIKKPKIKKAASRKPKQKGLF
jgi:hypothetical protein